MCKQQHFHLIVKFAFHKKMFCVNLVLAILKLFSHQIVNLYGTSNEPHYFTCKRPNDRILKRNVLICAYMLAFSYNDASCKCLLEIQLPFCAVNTQSSSCLDFLMYFNAHYLNAKWSSFSFCVVSV